MKHNQVIAGILFVLFMLVITACGGGGTGGTDGSTSGGPYTSIRVEAVIEGTSTSIDPTNIFTNEHIQFRLTGVDINSTRVVIPTSGWTLSGNPGGSITTAGLFTANASPSGSSGTVSVNFDFTNYSTSVRVVTADAVIVGVGRTTTGAPARGVQILALNGAGNVVATGTISSTGAIRMSAPPTAVRFTTSFTAIDPGPTFFYARQFAYGGKDFSTAIASCTAPLPVLTSGVASNLATDVVFYANSSGFPPPPPDGCQ